MKKVILGIISLIFLFGCFVYFVWSNQENDFNELKTEIVFIIDNSNLTEYQEDKIIYYLYIYKRDDYSSGEWGRVYYLDGFKRFLLHRDYDFWYEIKEIFNEN